MKQIIFLIWICTSLSMITWSCEPLKEVENNDDDDDDDDDDETYSIDVRWNIAGSEVCDFTYFNPLDNESTSLSFNQVQISVYPTREKMLMGCLRPNGRS